MLSADETCSHGNRSSLTALQRCHTGPEDCFPHGFNCAWGGGWDDLSLLVSHTEPAACHENPSDCSGGLQGRLTALCWGWLDLSHWPLLPKSHTCQNEACCRDFVTVAVYLLLTFWFFPSSAVADGNCAVFLFFRAIMEHKELLRVQWDWQIGKLVILTVFTLGLIAWSQPELNSIILSLPLVSFHNVPLNLKAVLLQIIPFLASIFVYLKKKVVH